MYNRCCDPNLLLQSDGGDNCANAPDEQQLAHVHKTKHAIRDPTKKTSKIQIVEKQKSKQNSLWDLADMRLPSLAEPGS